MHYIYIYIYTHIYATSQGYDTVLKNCNSFTDCALAFLLSAGLRRLLSAPAGTPNLPTKIIPAKIAGLTISWKFTMGLGILPLKLTILLESTPLKSIILVRLSDIRGVVSQRVAEYMD